MDKSAAFLSVISVLCISSDNAIGEHIPDIDIAMEWYKSLSISQKMALKEESATICGISWVDLNVMFTLREKIGLLYNKLKIEGIIGK